MNNSTICAITTLIISIVMFGTSNADARPLQVEDLFAIENVASPVISPDGAWIAYTTSRPDWDANDYEVVLYLVSSAGGDPIRITDEGEIAGSPSWKPDGTALTYVASGRNHTPQVWAYYPATRSKRQLTDAAQGVSGFVWSPTEDRLALVIRDAPPDDPAWEKVPPPWVIDRQQFKVDGVGYLDRRRFHIYVFDLKTGAVEQITFGDFDDASPSWSPDGFQIAFSSNRTDNPDGNMNDDIWVVPVDGTSHPLTKISTSPGTDWGPVWSPDGRHIAYLTYLNPDAFYFWLRKLVVHDLKESTSRMITKDVDLSEHRATFSPDGSEIYFLTDVRGRVNLAKVDVATGVSTVVEEGDQWIFSFSIAEDGTIAAVIGTIDAPGGYWTGGNVFILDDGKKRQITRHNEALGSEVNLALIERIDLPGHDGREIEGWLYKPADFSADKTYPLLIRVHGGPIAQWGHKFNFLAQLMAANGYLVLLPNPRGSSGYGHDFQLQVIRPFGPPAARDVIAAAKHLSQRPYIDGDRMGVFGWSFGGGAVNHIITNSDLFAVAISGAGSSSYYAEYGTNQYQSAEEQLLGGLPWENREAWEEIAAFNRVQHAVTPTMFVCGEKDWNVPVTNSERMYQAMKRLGRDVLLVVYPGESHVITVPRYMKHMHELYLDWFGRHLKQQ